MNVSLFLIFTLVLSFAQAACPWNEAGAKLWSKGSTWGGTVPKKNDVVTIPADTTILLNTSPPALRGIKVKGKLVFANKDIDLKLDYILIQNGGELWIGSEDCTYNKKAVITLTTPNVWNNDGFTRFQAGIDPENLSDSGSKVIAVLKGGRLELHGKSKHSWTKLLDPALKGAKKIRVKDEVNWKPGDNFVISSTDYDQFQAEELEVSSVDGKLIHFTSALRYDHYAGSYKTIKMQAEVGLLTRNIVIQGANDDASNVHGYGCHTINHRNHKRVYIEGVEFTRCGQEGLLARYPAHEHMSGNVANKSFIRNNSFHHNFQRSITIHGTDNAVVEHNVAYDTIGHSIFFEDGVERYNKVKYNLVLVVRPGSLIEEDSDPSCYWISAPNNVFVGNVCGGSDTFGYWYRLLDEPTGLFRDLFPEQIEDFKPNKTKLGVFKNNEAHSVGRTGLFVDDGAYYPPETAVFENFLGWRSRMRCLWGRGGPHEYLRPKCSDNRIGATFPALGSGVKLIGGVFVAESPNLGNPGNEPTGRGGRSLPTPYKPSEPIRGWEFYDGPSGIEDSKFYGFKPTSLRDSMALSVLFNNRFGMHPENYARNLSFDKQSLRVNFNSNFGDGANTVTFIDKDGSVAGAEYAKWHIIKDDPILVKSKCDCKPEWNACICPPKSYGKLQVINNDESGSNVTIQCPEREMQLGFIRKGLPNEQMMLIGTPSGTFRGNAVIGEIPVQFQSTILTNYEYTMHFQSSVPDDFNVSMTYMHAKRWINLGICMPPDYSTNGLLITKSGSGSSSVTKASGWTGFMNANGDKWYWDSEKKYLWLRFYQADDRSDWYDREHITFTITHNPSALLGECCVNNYSNPSCTPGVDIDTIYKPKFNPYNDDPCDTETCCTLLNENFESLPLSDEGWRYYTGYSEKSITQIPTGSGGYGGSVGFKPSFNGSSRRRLYSYYQFFAQEEAYLEFNFHPNGVSLPPNSQNESLEGNYIKLACLYGQSGHKLNCLYMVSGDVAGCYADGQYALMFEYQDEVDTFSNKRTLYDLSNSWHHIRLGAKLGEFNRLWLDGKLVNSYEGVTHRENVGIGRFYIGIVDNLDSNFNPSGTLKFDNIKVRAPRQSLDMPKVPGSVPVPKTGHACPSCWVVESSTFNNQDIPNGWSFSGSGQSYAASGGLNGTAAYKQNLVETRARLEVPFTGGKEVYASFHVNPNGVDLNNNLEGKVRIGCLYGANWYRITCVDLVSKAHSGCGISTKYGLVFSYDTKDGFRTDEHVVFPLSNNNGFNKIVLGTKLNRWNGLWINDKLVLFQNNGVYHTEASNIARFYVGHTSDFPDSILKGSGSLLFDNVEILVPALTDLWVNGNTGNDSNSGLESGKPLKTIGAASFLAGPGTTIHIGPGKYAETIRPVRSGTKKNPITYSGKSASKSIVTGAYTIKPRAWKSVVGTNDESLFPNPSKVYFVKLGRLVDLDADYEPEFLVREGKLAPQAREPREQLTNAWNQAQHWFTANGGSSTELTSADLKTVPSLTGKGYSATVVFLDSDSNAISQRTVLTHAKSAGKVTFDNVSYAPGKWSRFYVRNHPSLLNNNQEWWYDVQSQKLFIFESTKPSASGLKIKVPVREYGATLDGKEGVTFKNLGFEHFQNSAISVENYRESTKFIKVLRCTIKQSRRGFYLVSDQWPGEVVSGITFSKNLVKDTLEYGFLSSYYGNWERRAIKDITITRNHFSGAGIGHRGSARAIYVSRPDELRITKNEIEGSYQDAILLTNSEGNIGNILIDDNHIHHNALLMASPAVQVVEWTDADRPFSNVLISNNVIENNFGYNFYDQKTEDYSQEKYAGTALYLVGAGQHVYRNVLRGWGVRGIYAPESEGGEMVVWNNVIAGFSDGIYLAGDDDSTSSYQVVNNAFCGILYSGIYISSQSGNKNNLSNVVIKRNNYDNVGFVTDTNPSEWRHGPGYISNIGGFDASPTLSEWKSACSCDAGSTSKKSQFKNYDCSNVSALEQANNFQLSETSPLLNAGASASEIPSSLTNLINYFGIADGGASGVMNIGAYP